MKAIIKINLLIGFVLILTVITFAGFAQDNFDFGYDTAGNRTSRTISLKSATIQDGLASSQLVPPIEDKIGLATTRIYPNPTKGILYLEIATENNEQANLTVHDLNGKLIVQNEAILNNCDIDLSGSPSGIYILRVFIGAESKEWKVIKE
jgi:hypothetical protein